MKAHVLCFSLIASCCFVLGLGGCKSTETLLVGTYSVEEHGSLKELVRIAQDGDKFTIAMKDDRVWLPSEEVEAVDEDDVNRILDAPVAGSLQGLGNSRVAVLLVHPGWKSGAFVCKTGYWMASALGPMELHKN
jgi:hypothetical protein